MTHTGPMKESEGTFDRPTPTDCHCRKCDAMTVTVRPWDSSCGGYTDYRYDCSTCGHHWWIEGPDA